MKERLSIKNPRIILGDSLFFALYEFCSFVTKTWVPVGGDATLKLSEILGRVFVGHSFVTKEFCATCLDATDGRLIKADKSARTTTKKRKFGRYIEYRMNCAINLIAFILHRGQYKSYSAIVGIRALLSIYFLHVSNLFYTTTSN